MGDFQQAEGAFEQKRDQLKNAADERERLYNEKERQEREAAFSDLDGQKADEEAQVADLKGEYDYWMQMRKENALDDELFEEFSKQAEKTEKFLNEAQTKLDATTLRWEKENTLKEARDLEDAKNEAL